MVDDQREGQRDDSGAYGPQETDDTTEQDAGLAGGSGAAQGEASATPLATEPLEDDDDASA